MYNTLKRPLNLSSQIESDVRGGIFDLENDKNCTFKSILFHKKKT